ncbi:hypothetical protein QTA58_01190 [Neorhizobium sp. CSC1952]|uniref:hypothetical protein n=1 Tax=Neorhizobium sp. CSC1952 TaxID=2978974 RepID=UPI0025A55191|nr:hypothetical protein [Rhizobium sp. CSC1952]WJR67415.1 hypothetical protein QTA58_01190 [Rhizobium sp. CSC1952]
MEEATVDPPEQIPSRLAIVPAVVDDNEPMGIEKCRENFPEIQPAFYEGLLPFRFMPIEFHEDTPSADRNIDKNID